MLDATPDAVAWLQLTLAAERAPDQLEAREALPASGAGASMVIEPAHLVGGQLAVAQEREGVRRHAERALGGSLIDHG
jgi:hypothetical protein